MQIIIFVIQIANINLIINIKDYNNKIWKNGNVTNATKIFQMEDVRILCYILYISSVTPLAVEGSKRGQSR